MVVFSCFIACVLLSLCIITILMAYLSNTAETYVMYTARNAYVVTVAVKVRQALLTFQISKGR